MVFHPTKGFLFLFKIFDMFTWFKILKLQKWCKVVEFPSWPYVLTTQFFLQATNVSSFLPEVFCAYTSTNTSSSAKRFLFFSIDN